jgi:4-amino-4-deoxy-L-arabinose transferase-like glycosyltransferase
MRTILEKNWIFLAALCLLFPALLINLGTMTLIDDEAIRALVALEMKLSGNYITPTLHGAFYYNKPPLFNWILLLFFEVSGKFDELTARIPTVLALLGYAWIVFVVFRRYYGVKTGFLVAFMTITCGRILFWDSMLALIDILFSGLVFALFMFTFNYSSREKWGVLFLGTYALTAVAFLLKGLPALVFQGITLVVVLSWQGRFRRLFSWAHAAGVTLFVCMVGTYYAVYAQYNGLDIVFETLFRESSKRTVAAHGLWKTIGHVFTFPVEMLYHFFPWSFLVLYSFDRNFLDWLRKDRFVYFLTLVFLANVSVYWISPGVFPRYLLMFAPLVFGVGIRLHEWHRERQTRLFRAMHVFFLILLLAMALVSWIPLFLGRLDGIAYRMEKTLFVGTAMLAVLYFLVWHRKSRVSALVLALLLARISFNWFVIPDRNAHDFGNLCRVSSKTVGAKWREKELLVYKETDMQPTNSFYLTVARGKIIRRSWDPVDKKAGYIIEGKAYPGVSYTRIDSILVRHGRRTFDIGVFTQDAAKSPSAPR